MPFPVPRFRGNKVLAPVSPLVLLPAPPPACPLLVPTGLRSWVCPRAIRAQTGPPPPHGQDIRAVKSPTGHATERHLQRTSQPFPSLRQSPTGPVGQVPGWAPGVLNTWSPLSGCESHPRAETWGREARGLRSHGHNLPVSLEVLASAPGGGQNQAGPCFGGTETQFGGDEPVY